MDSIHNIPLQIERIRDDDRFGGVLLLRLLEKC